MEWELKAAGGVGEHGRNCFLWCCGGQGLLLDCGSMPAGKDEEAYPLLKKKEIAGLRWLFLSHSHRDHVGGLNWLLARGFHGAIWSSLETRRQIAVDYPDWHILPVPGQDGPFTIALDEGVTVSYGRSGHCIGALWFLVDWQGEKLLYSGDYAQNTVYRVDPIQAVSARWAILDCTYGDKIVLRSSAEAEIRRKIEKAAQDQRPLVFPVPRQGRGLALARLAQQESALPVYGDGTLFDAQSRNADWLIDPLPVSLKPLESWDGGAAVLLVADGQLAAKASRSLVKEVLKQGGEVVLTGYCYKGSYARRTLKKEKRVERIAYPGHLDLAMAGRLVRSNQFTNVLFFHWEQPFSDPQGLSAVCPTGRSVKWSE
jgi:glyoxylase-like metal-dependent hydrolase (beta-lactamase superfamily II)